MDEKHKTALGTSYFFIGVFPEKEKIVKAESLAELEVKAAKIHKMTDALKDTIDKVDAIKKFKAIQDQYFVERFVSNELRFTYTFRQPLKSGNGYKTESIELDRIDGSFGQTVSESKIVEGELDFNTYIGYVGVCGKYRKKDSKF